MTEPTATPSTVVVTGWRPCLVEGLGQCWEYAQERDGEPHAHVIPQAAFEWRAAEYGIDDITEITEMLLLEPFLPSDAPPPVTYLDEPVDQPAAPGTAAARAALADGTETAPLPGPDLVREPPEVNLARQRARLAAVRGAVTVVMPAAPVAARAATSDVPAAPAIDPEKVAAKARYLELRRRLASGGALTEAEAEELRRFAP
ncbi:hypothetical protein [Allostreptomyces psammosilenae]|uniref:Uncharacterized protein n=1 Tax=Allostreptomyces psammosilenae TaxID=1892865 RepID=A0A852ZTS6_9ACTN|nr:hypothetical protein [Allostreptomyces psammosilenae]NYI05255.1 hypothetical protein [Allostreptomyces psammosilenae]